MKLALFSSCIPERIPMYRRCSEFSKLKTYKLLEWLKVSLESDNPDMAGLVLQVLKSRHVIIDNHFLIESVDRGRCKISDLLLDYGLNPDCRDGYCLAKAAGTGESELVNILLRHGANPALNNSEALIRACDIGFRSHVFSYKNHQKIIENLIAYGAKPNTKNGGPLYVAAKNGRSKIIELLCRAGADPTLNNNAALKIAAQKKHDKAVLALLYFGADFNSLDFYYSAIYKELYDKLQKHKEQQHEIGGYVYGGCFFSWKSTEEEQCDYLFKLEAESKLADIKKKI